MFSSYFTDSYDTEDYRDEQQGSIISSIISQLRYVEFIHRWLEELV